MSDDESSSSSDDYLVAPDKINLDSEFFSQSTSRKPNPTPDCPSSSDSDDFEEERKDTSVLLAEVMRNLEKAKSRPDMLAVPSKTSTPGKKSQQDLADEVNALLADEINALGGGESGLGVSLETDNDDDDEKNVSEESKHTIPKDGITITIPGTEMLFNRRKKRGIDLEAELVKKMNQRLRSSQLYIHKVGLLCWLAHGFHLNLQANAPEVLSTAMSLVPQEICPDGRVDLKYLEGFTKWFKRVIKVELNKEDHGVTKEMLLERMRKKTAHNHRELVLIYIATLRAIGLNCRLIVSLCPPAMKVTRDQLFQVPDRSKNEGKGEKAQILKKEGSGVNKSEKKEENPKRHGSTEGKVKSEDKKQVKSLKKGQWNLRKKDGSQEERKLSPSKIIPENSCAGDSAAKNAAKKKAVQVFLAKFSRDPDKKSIPGIKQLDENDEGTNQTPIVKRLRSWTGNATETEKVAASKDISVKPSSKAGKATLDLKKVSQRVGKSSGATASAKANVERRESDDSYLGTDSESESDSSEHFSPPKKRKIESKNSKPVESKKKVKTKIKSERESNPKASTSRKSSIDRRVLSSDEEDEVKKFDARDTTYLWAEVYVESEESWISVSVPDEKIHCVSEIFKKIPRPVLYIIGWNSMGTLKDITRRYCPHWLTDTRKQRIDEKWWKESLETWAERETAISRAEDEMLLQKELEQPLPKTLTECKGHPLYVVQRHLLKFEALYPPDCVPLGHLKTGDAIYSRHCVHTLRSRETWHKEARVVKPASEAYKIVKAMPKWDKFTGQRMKDQPLELFGQWQTTPYIPPEVKDGVIPRNEYGNVDLFKQCMLPKGAVHIDLPGLNRIAKKLHIDCAPACVGFNFGCRGALPAFEGFVVAEEHEDTLREAWEEEQIAAAKRAKEKREKRIWGNWRKLIRGLMIKQRLAVKYDLGADDHAEDNVRGESSEPAVKRKKKGDKKP
ncbi:DNA repair protein complementing XP-C cells homolog [Fopius arisanus]|uniref:DNA repair protein complementing XP-C cells homolog n=1 Tax=Fopius arisanus TaxID=64838 RepID=A0A9R1TW04_9HYME|nr:PREDICTED: DNA repair protein complementing XP-C cells homolog [Fopius arisanus]